MARRREPNGRMYGIVREREDEGRHYLHRMTNLIEDIRAKFPIQTIPNIIGEPIYKATNELREELYANSSAIPTTLRGGKNDHIGLIMDTSVYTNVATTTYARPTEPVPFSQHGPGESAAARADTNEIHK